MSGKMNDIHPNAKLGKNVNVESFTTIDEDVEIGDNTWIGPNVSIMNGARIGKNCRIFPGAIISAIPQDLKFNGENSTVIIGDNVTINRGTIDKHLTRIGNNCLLMAYVHIAHDCILENNVILANGVTLAGHIHIGPYANVGGLVAVQQFVNLGQHSYIGGGSLVRKDVPPYTKGAREPLSYVGINSVGLRRKGFDADKIKEIQEIYRQIYLRGMNITQAILKIEAELPATQERDEIISFIRDSDRGIMRGYRA